MNIPLENVLKLFRSVVEFLKLVCFEVCYVLEMAVLGFEVNPKYFQFTFGSQEQSCWIHLIVDPKLPKNGISLTNNLHKMPDLAFQK